MVVSHGSSSVIEGLMDRMALLIIEQATCRCGDKSSDAVEMAEIILMT